MFRWLILAITFGVWVLCMFAVYVHCKPPPLQESIPGMEAGLEPLFSEEPSHAWLVFVDLRGLKDDAKNSPIARWSGENEAQLFEVGKLASTLKKKEGDESRLEQRTAADFAIPPDAGLPLLALMGQLHYESRSDISRETGLEVFNATFNLGQDLRVETHGVRDGVDLEVTQQLFRNHDKLMDERTVIPVGKRGMPLVELFPFQRNEQVKEGYSWDIVMLDAGLADLVGKTRPKLAPIRVKCTGRQDIFHDGQRKPALNVSSEDGKARAWYSPDGIVLKQAYTISAGLELMLVRADPKTVRNPRPWGR
jgi:hypothetical protein